MTRAGWLKERFEDLVTQGLGVWIERSNTLDLGVGIYCWKDGPTVQIFSDGFTYDAESSFEVRYEEITALELLDLRALMKAQKTPRQSVELAANTISRRYLLRIPLFLYTTLSGVLNSIASEGR